MHAAILQFAPQYGRPAENLDRVDRLLSGVDADLIVLPELFTSGYFFRSTEEAREMAEPIPGGATTRRLEEWAARHEAVLVGGLPERDGETLYNSAVVAGPGGYVGRYRKTHLYYEEKTYFSPGEDGFSAFEAESGDGTTSGTVLATYPTLPTTPYA
jgi:predicted amidohydrolase